MEAKVGEDHGLITEALEREIAQQTWGRAQQLQIQVNESNIVVRGKVTSYYIKQRALHAVMSVLGSPPMLPVELDIDVGVS